jgi:O-antigen ligase
MVQATGTEAHQNILGMMIHFVTLPAFALLLSWRTGWLLMAAPIIGVLIDILTASRGALGFSLLGYAILFVFSSMRSWTNRKRKVLLAGFAVLLAVIPLAISSISDRFSEQAVLLSSDYNERSAFEKAATMMLNDSPLGKGANHYVIVANLEGYNHRADVANVAGSYGANVHNVYMLVAAETGYPGLITFINMLLWPLVVAMLCGWINRADRRGDLLIGLGVSLLTVYSHSFFEWVFLELDTQYMFAANVGLIAGLALELGYWHRSPPGATLVKANGLIRPDRAQEPAVRNLEDLNFRL